MNTTSGPVVAAVGIALLLVIVGVVAVLAGGSGVPGTADVSDATATPTQMGVGASAATATPEPTPSATPSATATATPTPNAPASPTATAPPQTPTATPTPATATATPTSTPTPSSSETSRHAINATVPDDVEASGEQYAAAAVDYGAATGGDAPSVSDVRAGVDHRDEHYRDEYGGGDEPGANVDENLTVTDIETRDGVLHVTFAEEVDMRPEDELVLVVTGDTPAADTVPVTIEGTDVTVEVEGTVTEYRDGSDAGNGTATPTPTA